MTHRFEEHTAEVSVRIDAASLPALFEDAAAALCELQLGDEATVGPERVERVSVRGRDRESLLVAFLNELIFLSETEKLVFSKSRVTSVADHELHAVVHGATPSVLRTQVKAATMHGVHIVPNGSGFTATVILDV